MTAHEPQVVDVPGAGRFELRIGDEVAGHAEYRPSAAGTAFTHTAVEPRFEGRGLGSVLVRGALDVTRAAGRPVLPFCPFVRSWVERHPEYLDLVPAERRAGFGL